MQRRPADTYRAEGLLVFDNEASRTQWQAITEPTRVECCGIVQTASPAALLKRAALAPYVKPRWMTKIEALIAAADGELVHVSINESTGDQRTLSAGIVDREESAKTYRDGAAAPLFMPSASQEP
ncbi:hypothetical protein [Ferrimicrobium sp.]|nr:hypothetical protein [Ferrimicrobium sp.]